MGALLSTYETSRIPKIHYPDEPNYFPIKKSTTSKDGTDEEEVEQTSLRAFVEQRCPSLHNEFKPAWWLFNGHLQTGWCVVGDFSKVDKVVYERKCIRLVDGGTLGLDFTPPFEEQRHMKEDTPVIVVLHGLTGGSYEAYVRAILAPACRPVAEGGLGYRAVVVNFRGCAGVPITSPQLYSAGHTDDIRQALFYITKRYPNAPFLGVGFSLGANVLVKYLAEEGPNSRLVAGVSLGCPWDLKANNDALKGDFVSRNVYAKTLGRNLVNLVRINASSMIKFTERGCAQQISVALNLKGPTLEDFDNAMTRFFGGTDRPHGVFPLDKAEDYYRWASTHKVVADVGVPFLAINAADDPVVQKVPMNAGGNGLCAMVLTAKGGHLGWFEAGDRRWITKPVLEWLHAVGTDLVYNKTRGRPLREVDGYIKEEGDDRLHLGCYELEGGGILMGTDGEGFLAGL
ncbi:hypothetical protein PLICRDRAFT_111152 [Plicaturopsis crispa FD-325 SS-3]|nr:hypothetical protein PLICRDRAFT_111152 [Plicaturopsis crispa FD-325 SS-3]